MTKQQILKKAIAKAEENGWKNRYDDLLSPTLDPGWKEDYLVKSGEYFKIIFSHPFAQAIWGFKLIYGNEYLNRSGEGTCEVAWKHHLQQMVLEQDPLLYLKDFI